ncbi:hypothetical protein [Pseudoalteromonas galatheae]|uniref:hypothetical protein n=1 Tax=Pseudoalteromonas galatheae TaxID=579562 RepID=UPI0030D0461E
MEIIKRNELPDDFSDMMQTEQHHEHEIVKDEHGVLRWRSDPFIEQFANDCSLNDIVRGFHSNGNGKNNESYRELYRKMGYSLSGYWEVFYWEANNPDADNYHPPRI